MFLVQNSVLLCFSIAFVVEQSHRPVRLNFFMAVVDERANFIAADSFILLFTLFA